MMVTHPDDPACWIIWGLVAAAAVRIDDNGSIGPMYGNKSGVCSDGITLLYRITTSQDIGRQIDILFITG